MLKNIAFIATLLLIASPVVWLDLRSDRPPLPVRQASTEPAVHALGIVEGQTEDVVLHCESAGQVAVLHADVGDWVNQGDLLLEVDNRRQRQQVAASKAELELARAQLERLLNGARQSERDEARALLAAKRARLDQAVRAWRRIDALEVQGAISAQEEERHQGEVATWTAEVAAAEAKVAQLEAPARDDEVRAARARLGVAESNLELAELTLEKTQLRAPLNGQVLDVNVRVGEVLSGEVAHPVIVMSDTSQLRVRAYVEEIDALTLQPGMAAEVYADGLPEKEFAGRLASLSPRMQAKTLSSGRANELYDTKVREVLVDLQAPRGLLVGLRVDVRFSRDAKIELGPTATASVVAATSKRPDADYSQ